MRDINRRAADAAARLTPYLSGGHGMAANMLLIRLIDCASRDTEDHYAEITGYAAGRVGTVAGGQRWLTAALGLGTSTATLLRYLEQLADLGVVDIRQAKAAWSDRRVGVVVVRYEVIAQLDPHRSEGGGRVVVEDGGPAVATVPVRPGPVTGERRRVMIHGGSRTIHHGSRDYIYRDLKDPPLPPEGVSDLERLEDLALSCIPPHATGGRAPSLDEVSRARLARLIDEHGAADIERTLADECGGAWVPVRYLAKVLERRDRTKRPARRKPGAQQPVEATDTTATAGSPAPWTQVELQPRPDVDQGAARKAAQLGLDLPDEAVPVGVGDDGRSVIVWTESPWAFDCWLTPDDRRFIRPIDDYTLCIGTDAGRVDPETVPRRPVARAQGLEPARSTGWGRVSPPAAQGGFSWR